MCNAATRLTVQRHKFSSSFRGAEAKRRPFGPRPGMTESFVCEKLGSEGIPGRRAMSQELIFELNNVRVTPYIAQFGSTSDRKYQQCSGKTRQRTQSTRHTPVLTGRGDIRSCNFKVRHAGAGRRELPGRNGRCRDCFSLAPGAVFCAETYLQAGSADAWWRCRGPHIKP